MCSCGENKTHTQASVADTTQTTANDTAGVSKAPDSAIDRNRIRIYLTFDDGPYMTTPKLVEFLKTKGIRASFFVVGSQIDYSRHYDSIFRSVRNHPDFKVYNHSYSHAVTKGRIDRYYSNPRAVWADIERNKKYLPEGSSITRLPGSNTWRTPSRMSGSQRTSPFVRLLVSGGHEEHIVGWDLEWTKKTSMDRENMRRLLRSTDSILQRRHAGQRNVVILSHDYLYRTDKSLELLGEFIDHFSAKDVYFDWVENLPDIKEQGSLIAYKGS